MNTEPETEPSSIIDQHTALVRRLIKNPEALVGEFNPVKANINHAIIGIAGEIFELLNAYAHADRDNVIEEVGDCMFYIRQLELELGIDPPAMIPNQAFDFALVSVSADAIIDHCKKHTIYNKVFDSHEPLKVHIAQLFGMFDSLGVEYDFTLEECRRANIDKLNERYGASYSDEAAEARADKN